MEIKMSQVVSKSDWVKIFILLAIAIIAWYFVFQEYSKPFDLQSEIERQQIIEQHELKKTQTNE